MIGPPTADREVALATGIFDVPWAWMVCLVAGAMLVWFGRRGTWALVGGLILLFTAPAGGLITTAVWGHYPTIDKAGSLHFYTLGAHFHSFDTSAAATQLIGVSMGHLWVTAVFDLFVAPFAAMNLQAFANLVLGWGLAAKLGELVGVERRWAIVAALPMGLGLHLFADINWYTIEKSGVWALTLYAYVLLRAVREGKGWLPLSAAAYFWAFYYNAYWGVLAALIGSGVFLGGGPRARLPVLISAIGALPFLALQLPALRNSQLPPPEAFATRAALDSVTLWPPTWARLELWAALDWVVCGAAVFGVAEALRARFGPRRRAEASPEVGVSTVAVPIGATGDAAGGPLAGWPGAELRFGAGLVGAAVLALGPATFVYSAFAKAPGMWRFAKPETFFHLVVLGSTLLAGRTLSRSRLNPWAVLAVQLGLWLWFTRLHPAYPGFSEP